MAGIFDQAPTIGKRYKYRDFEFYAMDGSIVYIDTRTGEFHYFRICDFLERAVALHRAMGHWAWADERVRDQRFALDCAECVKEAHSQGDPFDPDVSRHTRQAIRRRSSVLMDVRPSKPVVRPGSRPVASPKELPRLRATRRQVELGIY